MWWSSLFTDMRPSDFFNFSFLPKYGVAFVRGIEYTLLLAVVSVLLAVIPALLLALMRLSKVKPVKWLSGAYIAVFRSTPMLVQLSIIYFGLFYAISLPRVSLFGFVDISRFVPGVVALALNSSAYVAEIFRAGILAVDKGQTEAARSLGLSSWQAMRLVVLPQAIKNILPAIANEFVTIIKESAICYTIGVQDIMSVVNSVKGATYRMGEALVIATVLYFCLTYPTSKVIEHFEKKMSVGDRRNGETGRKKAKARQAQLLSEQERSASTLGKGGNGQ